MLTPAYRVLHYRDYPCILCLVCNRISHNHNDITHRYCGACHLFLNDLPDDFRQPNTAGVSPGLLLTGAEDEEPHA